MTRIVAALDFSPASSRIADYAADLARWQGAPLWLLHVAPPDPAFVGYDAGPKSVRDQVAKDLREEHRQIQAEADRLRQTGLQVTALCLQGPTLETLLKEFELIKPDWIVVGSHGHGALYHLWMGSVGQGIVARSTCPVVVVPVRATGP